MFSPVYYLYELLFLVHLRPSPDYIARALWSINICVMCWMEKKRYCLLMLYNVVCLCMTFERSVLQCFWCVFYKLTNISLTFRRTVHCVWHPVFYLRDTCNRKKALYFTLPFITMQSSFSAIPIPRLNNRPIFYRPIWETYLHFASSDITSYRAINLQLECFCQKIECVRQTGYGHSRYHSGCFPFHSKSHDLGLFNSCPVFMVFPRDFRSH